MDATIAKYALHDVYNAVNVLPITHEAHYNHLSGSRCLACFAYRSTCVAKIAQFFGGSPILASSHQGSATAATIAVPVPVGAYRYYS